jgi:hypothetical protein
MQRTCLPLSVGMKGVMRMRQLYGDDYKVGVRHHDVARNPMTSLATP